jgi:hypothetical protein
MAAKQLDVMRKNCADFGLPLYDSGDREIRALSM